ncbi:MAG: glycerophosphodiester phosphodiesterase family protein, partial [Myxococcota bacterium]
MSNSIQTQRSGWLLLAVAVCNMNGCTQAPVNRPPIPLAGVAGPLVIAHRGGSLEAPENTLAAIRHAVDIGTDWQEIDVTLSKDGAVVVIHDDELERTTSGHGLVAQHNLADLQKLRAGRPTWRDEKRQALLTRFGIEVPDFGERFAAETIPTFEEVLGVAGARLMVELKTVSPDRVKELAKKVVAAVRRSDSYDRVIIGSFAADLLWAVHDLEPSLPLIGIAEDPLGIDRMLNLPVAALAVHTDQVSTALEASPPGIAVWVWTIYSVEMGETAFQQGAH